MKRSRLLLLVLLWGVFTVFGAWRILFAVRTHVDQQVQEDGSTRLAATIATDFQKRLGAALHAALARGGPVAAIEVCGREARQIASDLQLEHPSVRVLRRTALRVRNPENAPDSYERGWMERAAVGTTAAEPVRPYHYVEDLPDRTRELQYMGPIYLKPGCVLCHGTPEQIPAAVKQALAASYPQDRAIGFAPGEFRGLISIHIAMPRVDAAGP